MTNAALLVSPDFTNSTLEQVRNNMKNSKHMAKALVEARTERITFDPANAEHRAAFVIFEQTGKWVMKFYNEAPYPSVVATAQAKLLKYFLAKYVPETTVNRVKAKHTIEATLVTPEPEKTKVVPINNHIQLEKM